MRSRKLWLGALSTFAFMLGAFWRLGQALELGADLTAFGVALGAIAAGVATIVGLYIKGNIDEKRVQNGGGK